MTMDEHARRRREELIAVQRRRELDRRAEALDKELSELKLRYLRDRLTAVPAESPMRSSAVS